MQNDVSRYLVAPKETGSSKHRELLNEVAGLVEQIHGASVMRRRSATGDLEQLNISITAEKAEELKARFGHGLIIESDEPLKY
jgi:hypothetical protein